MVDESFKKSIDKTGIGSARHGDHPKIDKIICYPYYWALNYNFPAYEGDWIIKGAGGDLYSVEDIYFKKNYELTN